MKDKHLTDILKLVDSISTSQGEMSYSGGRITLSLPEGDRVPVSRPVAEALLREKNQFAA
jgi:hypothetical protein